MSADEELSFASSRLGQSADAAPALPFAVASQPPVTGSSAPVTAYRPRPSAVRLGWVFGYLAAALVLFLCYLRESYTAAVTSDGASNALQAWDMLHGNPLLRGWSLSDVSFYSTELPEYMLVEMVRGLGAWDVHVAAAITYTLLVLLAGLVAKGRAGGREGLLRALIASGIMIAPQYGAGAFILLLSPDHVGTGVPLLLTWLILDRCPRRAYLPVITGALLTWAALGDSLVWLLGALPIVCLCGLAVFGGSRRLGRPVRAHRFELALGGAALGSVAASWLIVRLIGWAGGYSMRPMLIGVFSPGAWWANVRLTVEAVLGLYGADFYNGKPGLSLAVALVHLIGLGLASWALCLALRRLPSFWRAERSWRPGELLESAIALAIAVNVAVYLFSDLPHQYWDSREVAVVLPYGAVLAGRLLPGRLLSLAGRAGQLRGWLPIAAAAGAACYLAALGFAVGHPQRPAHDQALTTWLLAHHLRCGLGSYAEANSTTLDSGGAVQLRAPSWTPDGAYPSAYNSRDTWFDPGACDANFAVSTMEDGAGFYLPPAWASAAFGEPVSAYRYQVYTIWVWHKNLLAGLHPGPCRQCGSPDLVRPGLAGLASVQWPAHPRYLVR